MAKAKGLDVIIWHGHQLNKLGHETWLRRPRPYYASFQEISTPDIFF